MCGSSDCVMADFPSIATQSIPLLAAACLPYRDRLTVPATSDSRHQEEIMKKFGGSAHDDVTTDTHHPCDFARRDFLQQAAAIGAGAALFSVPLVASAQGSQPALQKVLD